MKGSKVYLLTGFIIFLTCKMAIYSQNRFRIAELNVENLFDCRHDEGKLDEMFLPTAIRRWTTSRYWRKQEALSKELIALGGDIPADLIALCEVENDSVMHDMTERSILRSVGYRYIITDSPDERGIDVALLYQPQTFKLINWQALRVNFGLLPPKHTRDVLHVTGRLQTGDTLDVYVCHLPSRLGGKKYTDPYRLCVSQMIRHSVDSIMRCRCHPLVVITGDFNDTVNGVAFREGLKIEPFSEDILPSVFSLYNIGEGKIGNNGAKGTYYYDKEWETIDHLIVSGGLLLKSASLHTSPSFFCLADFPFLLQWDEWKNCFPFRTYKGMRYQAGYSDHLPIYADFFYSW